MSPRPPAKLDKGLALWRRPYYGIDAARATARRADIRNGLPCHHTLRAAAETRLSKKHWAEAQVDWVPLRRAICVFLFATPTTKFVDEALRRGWMEALARRSKTRQIRIDPNTLEFSFRLVHYGVWIFGPPWEILRETPVVPNLRFKLGSAEGRMDEEWNVRLRRRYEVLRWATGYVWHQLMLPPFRRAVSEGAVVLYARPKTLSAPFEQLTADVWPSLEKSVDWASGVAFARDGSPYHSIHVAPTTSGVLVEAVQIRPRGRKPLRLEMVKEAMRRDLLERRLTLADLINMYEKTLAETYGVSRETVRKARNTVVTELSGILTPKHQP
jgi:hypothetical protein